MREQIVTREMWERYERNRARKLRGEYISAQEYKEMTGIANGSINLKERSVRSPYSNNSR